MSGRYWKPGKSFRVKRALLALAVIVAAFAGLSWYDPAGADAPEVSGPQIEYDHLANQETDPFLFSGKLMDENHPQWSRYRKALRKFSDVRDCLIETEKFKDNPNLLRINWQELNKRPGAEGGGGKIGPHVGFVHAPGRYSGYIVHTFASRR